MNFSIIIPTRQRLDLLKKSIKSVLLLNYPTEKFEIIVVLNSQTEKTTENYLRLLKKTKINLTFFIETQVGPSFARNLGIKKAKYDHHIFVDDDVVVDRELLNQFKRIWTKFPDAYAIGGRIIAKPSVGILTHQEARTIHQFSWIFGQQEKGNNEHILNKDEILLSATLGTYQKEKLLFSNKLGVQLKPNETLLGGEDYEYILRLHLRGKQIIYSPSLFSTNFFDKARFSNLYIAKRHFFNGIEIYIADQLLKRSFYRYHNSFNEKLMRNFFSLFFLNFKVFKLNLRNRNDITMIFSYFFCGKYFFD